jgi:hypothetical protein
VFGRPAPPAQALSSGDPLRSAAADERKLSEADEPSAGDATAVLADAPHETGATTPGDEAATSAPAGGDAPQAAADEPTGGDDTAVLADSPPEAARPETAATPGDDTEAAADEPRDGGDAGKSPFSGLRNGRADDHTPPELSSGDPRAMRERGS